MQYDDASVDYKTVKRPAYTGSAPGPQFEQTFAKGARVWQSKAGAVFSQQFDQSRIVGDDINRPGFDLRQYAGMEVFDLECHG